MSTPPRLLVTVPRTPELDAALRAELPRIPVLYAKGAGDGPWPSIEAALVGVPEREMPGFRAASVPGLRFVQRLYTGLDNFPFHWFPETVMVAGNGGGYAVPVAEHATALVLALARGLVRDHASVVRGGKHQGPPQMSLLGKTCLVLGYGAIGAELAPRLKGLGLTVVGVTRTGKPKAGADAMIPRSQVLSALARADVVINCLPLTRETVGFLGEKEFSALSPRSILVSVGRGPTIDRGALTRFLQSHPDFRVGLDVWWDERNGLGQLEGGVSLSQFPNAIGTPHTGGLGEEARGWALRHAMRNLARFFRGETPLHLARREDYRGLGDPTHLGE